MRVADIEVDMSTPEGRRKGLEDLRVKLEEAGKESSEKLLGKLQSILDGLDAMTPDERIVDKAGFRVGEIAAELSDLSSKILNYGMTQTHPGETYTFGQINSFLVVASGALEMAKQTISEHLQRNVGKHGSESPTEPPPAPEQAAAQA